MRALPTSNQLGLLAAVATTAATLFGVGYFAVWLADHRPVVSGLHFLLIAIGVAAVGYLVGYAISRIGGPNTVPVP